MTKDEFLRRVYSVDIEAGDRLRYMMAVASCCPKFKDKISFTDAYTRAKLASKGLIRLFVWDDSTEGDRFWNQVYSKLLSAKL